MTSANGSKIFNLTIFIPANAILTTSTVNNTDLVPNATKQVQRPQLGQSYATIIVQVTLLAILGAVIALGNLALIVTFFKTHYLRRRRSYSLIISLAFADFLVGVTDFMVMYYFLASTNEPQFLMALNFVDIFSGNASILILLVIALERFYAVFSPHQYRVLKLKFYMMCIVLPWLAALIIGSGFLLNALQLTSRTFNVIYTLSRCFLAVAALIIIIVCYTSIFLKLSKSNSVAQSPSTNDQIRSSGVQSQSSHDQNRSGHDQIRSSHDRTRSTHDEHGSTNHQNRSTQNRNRSTNDQNRSAHDQSRSTNHRNQTIHAQNRNRSIRERKLSVTLVIVTFASLVTWLPHLCVLIVVLFAKASITLFFIVKYFQYCNSGINFFIYIARMPDIRHAFLALLRKTFGNKIANRRERNGTSSVHKNHEQYNQ